MEINTLLPKFRRRMAIFCPPNMKSNIVYLNGQVIWEKAVSDSGSSRFKQLDLGSNVLFQIYKQRKLLKTVMS